jgi:DNA repair exonuclease SbcCD ATPase subunit
VHAAHVTWRPLGALLVEKGLLTSEELEDALAAQQTTGKRLGQILVDRGHVSGPALTNALAEQYGIELKTEEGFGTGLRAEIERRHSTRRPPVAPEEAAVGLPPEALVETETNGDGGHDGLAGDVPLADLEPQLEEHWARLAAAEANVAAREARIAELEAELGALKHRPHESQADGSPAAAHRRFQEVTAERDGARRALELAETRAAELEEALQALAAVDHAHEDVREREVADRERELAEHEQVLAGRQRAVLTAAADLEQRRRSLEERERFLVRRDAPAHEAVPPSAEVRELAERRLPQPDAYGWSLDTLTRLVEESADDFPDRVDEWRYTLFYLRNEARIDGSLPRRFDALVEECFGELLDPRPAAAALAR